MTDLNRKFAELVGLCWHEETPYVESVCTCGNVYHVAKNMIRHIKHNNPDFVSDPRLVLREMDRIGKLDDFKKYSGVFIWMPEGHYIRVDYIADNTTGLLVKAAIEWMEKEEKGEISRASLEAWRMPEYKKGRSPR